MSDETHPIPDASDEVTHEKDMVAVVLPVQGYSVNEWCPTPDGTGPAEQVHVLFELPAPIPPMVVRFKSAGALDRFIAILARHRLSVWPKEPA